jgi:cell division protein FtsQ
VNNYRRIEHASRYPASRGFSSGMLTILALFAVSVAGTIWVSMGIVAREQWPIRWLELNGAFDRVSADQLRGSLSAAVNANFFTIDLQHVRTAAQRNSWVASVGVHKRWPDTVIVSVEEYVPIAHWNSGHLISSTGQVFAVPDADEIQGLPWLQGPDDRVDQVLTNWSQFDAMLDAVELEIDQLVLDQRGAWSMRLNKGTRLQLGRDQPAERLERLMSSWAVLLNEHALPPVLVDLRYSNGFAVHWPKDAADFAGNYPE